MKNPSMRTRMCMLKVRNVYQFATHMILIVQRTTRMRTSMFYETKHLFWKISSSIGKPRGEIMPMHEKSAWNGFSWLVLLILRVFATSLFCNETFEPVGNVCVISSCRTVRCYQLLDHWFCTFVDNTCECTKYHEIWRFLLGQRGIEPHTYLCRLLGAVRATVRVPCAGYLKELPQMPWPRRPLVSVYVSSLLCTALCRRIVCRWWRELKRNFVRVSISICKMKHTQTKYCEHIFQCAHSYCTTKKQLEQVTTRCMVL